MKTLVPSVRGTPGDFLRTQSPDFVSQFSLEYISKRGDPICTFVHIVFKALFFKVYFRAVSLKVYSFEKVLKSRKVAKVANSLK